MPQGEPVRRIVSLLPSATEILYALSAGDRVVGVTHECDYPPEARAKPHLTASALPQGFDSAAIDRHVRKQLHAGSSLYSLDSELLERLAPDLIITQELCPVCAVSYHVVTQATRELRGYVRIISLEPSSIEDVYANILAVGESIGVTERAKAVVAGLRNRERRLRQLTAMLARPRTLVLEWTDPAMGAGHWTPGLVELAGGAPVLANPGAASQRLEWPKIGETDPDIVLVAPCGYDLAITERETRALERNSTWTGLRAARAGKVALIDGSAYVNRPGPRLLDSAEIFTAAIHPELASQVPAYPSAWRWLSSRE